MLQFVSLIDLEAAKKASMPCVCALLFCEMPLMVTRQHFVSSQNVKACEVRCLVGQRMHVCLQGGLSAAGSG